MGKVRNNVRNSVFALSRCYRYKFAKTDNIHVFGYDVVSSKDQGHESVDANKFETDRHKSLFPL